MESVFDRAFAAHRAGRLAEAERDYRAALAANPSDADALHLFGVLRHQQGQNQEAADLVGRAVELRPNDAALHLNLGNALKALGRIDDAIVRFRNALTLAPDFPLAHYNLGNAYAAQERHEDAVDAFERALRLSPGDASIHNNLGNALNALGRHEAAFAAFRRALALRPGHAGAHNNLGMALAALGQADEAVSHFQAAIASEPRFAAAHFNLGNTLDAVGRHQEAVAAFETVLGLHPAFPLALLGLGNALAALGHHAQARARYERAVGLDPSLVLAWLNLGTAHHALGAHELALRAFDQALRLAPDHTLARMHRAVTLLTLRDFRRGLPEYEARHALPGAPAAGEPRWHGEPIEARTLLVRAEQGFGDTLQFARFVPLARERCARLVFEVQPELLSLFAPLAKAWRVGIVASGQGRHGADLGCSLLSLPFALGLDFDEIPSRTPYLSVPDHARRRFRGSLGGQSRRKLGVVWSGRRQVQENRAAPFAALAPLFEIPGVDWIVLQPELSAEDRAALAAHPQRARIHRAEGLDDFAATAALIDRLDGVVAIDTAVAHLTGALGKPLWLMLAFAADWRWFTGEDSPWYPRAELFRQREPGAWDPVVAAVAARIRAG
ncbi:TPR repeat [Burkholderia gladioli]|uniref:TPR domain protein n=1 Tax=Burkholderia gladioli (strain BSR3) TaxID=999541 RepID=F2LBZ8_BURGS|nr:tetratricopeptide repeat protein [Burkholderia gladioli]AEA59622.1 TPR domain protein [Burkholderia gladioli BSR3]MBW5285340.1 tetratricopeptide repeat protein [Burkholderia gladioli]CAG9237242.1 TPR repeat [Burkholderia gladioli]